MQDFLLGSSLGLLIALIVLSIRRGRWHLTSYWMGNVLFASSVWWMTALPDGMIAVLVIWALQWYVQGFFQQPFSLKRLVSVNLPAIFLMIAAIAFERFGNYLVPMGMLWSFVALLTVIHKVYSRKGINALGRSGPRILWINLATLHVGLMAIFVGYQVSPGVYGPLTITWLAYSIWHFARDGAFAYFDSAAKYTKSTLDVKEKARLLAELDALLQAPDYFFRPDSSLQGLAKLLRTNTHRLSQLLNESKGQSFFELQAQVRMQKAKALLADPDTSHLKIEEIGNQVGYASKSSFNTTFKKTVGRTPSAYRDQQVRSYKVERSEARVERDSLGVLDTFEWIQNSSVMFTNFFKVYFRTQRRNVLFSAINLIGLITGLCSALFIIVYLQHELSYDTFHQRSQDIYRVIWQSDNPQTRTPHPAAQALVRDFPEVERGVSLSPVYGSGLTLQSIYMRNPLNDRMFREPDVFSADSTFFDVFGFELLMGEPRRVLDDVGEIVITASLARKYFGDESPLGKLLEFVEYGFSGVVSGVMRDAPPASHFHPQVLISYISRKSMDPDSEWWTWADFGHFNYVKLHPDANPKGVEAAMIDWLPKYVDFSEEGLASLKQREHFLELQAIEDIHLHSDIRWELEANGNIVFVQILAASLVFLIVIVAINFINLTTVRAFERTKEVGVRRSLGAAKQAISLQFLMESVVTSCLALGCAFLLAVLLFPGFSGISGLPVSSNALWHPMVIGLAIAVALVIGLVTGIYPSVALVGMPAVQMLKGRYTPRTSTGRIQRTLVLIQFSVSAIMIFGSIVVLAQVKFMESKDLGFDSDQVLVMEIHDRAEMRRLEALKTEVLKIPGVIDAAGISNLPGQQFNQNPVFPVGDSHSEISFAEVMLDFGTLQLLGLDLIDGRWLDPSMGTDTLGTSFIVNEAAMQQLQLEDPFDTPIRWVTEGDGFVGKIVGVVEDFHYKSLHRSIQPLIMHINPRDMNYLMLKVSGGTNLSQVIARLEEVHAAFDQRFDLDYFFLDTVLDDQYRAERRALDIFQIFTLLAIIMAALGLLGMAFLVITQRTKEIGIRKVIGATPVNIWWMELRPFLLIVGMALLVGLPVSYLIMDSWLSGFAYRVTLNWSAFAASAIILLVVAVLTVSGAVIRTIIRNPSKSLRYE
ncbi:MAG: FtsX-like permease family protein [Bacteroidota bacterium]